MITVKLSPKFLKEELGLPYNPNADRGVKVIENSLSATERDLKFFDLIFEYDSKTYATYYYTGEKLGPWDAQDVDDFVECIQVIETEILTHVWVPL